MLMRYTEHSCFCYFMFHALPCGYLNDSESRESPLDAIFLFEARGGQRYLDISSEGRHAGRCDSKLPGH
jgi:hypothetical protein